MKIVKKLDATSRSPRQAKKPLNFYCEAANVRYYLKCPTQCKDCKREQKAANERTDTPSAIQANEPPIISTGGTLKKAFGLYISFDGMTWSEWRNSGKLAEYYADVRVLIDGKTFDMTAEEFKRRIEDTPSQSAEPVSLMNPDTGYGQANGANTPSSTRLIDLHEAAHDLLVACGMEEKNEAIRHGASGKAWDGSFVRKMKLDAMQRVRDLTESSGQNVASATRPMNDTDTRTRVPCRCGTDREKALCLDKSRCVKVEAL